MTPPAPRRIQRRHQRGWQLPDGATYVGRPSVFGNPFSTADLLKAGHARNRRDARHLVVDAYRDWLTDPRALWWQTREGRARRTTVLHLIPSLASRDLACWCPLDNPCHADVLLGLANPPDISTAQIIRTLSKHRFQYGSEAQLQQGIYGALTGCGLPVRREVRLSPADIVDFMVGPVAIEAKVAGPLADVVRQLTRYAHHHQVAELVLVTARAAHRAIPPTLAGTPVRTLWLQQAIG